MSTIVQPKIVWVKNKIVAEDVEFGLGHTIQLRNGKRVSGTQLNSKHIPFNDTMSVETAIIKLIDKVGGLD